MSTENKCPIGNHSPQDPEDEDSPDENADICYSSDSDDESVNDHSKKTSPNSLKVRAQKNIVGRVVKGRHSIRPLIGRAPAEALKSFERLVQSVVQSKSETKRIMHSTIKTVAKFWVAVKNRTLNDEQMHYAEGVKDEMRTVALTFISFARTEYTYNRKFLTDHLFQCQKYLLRSVTGVLSEKSHARINYIFSKITDPNLMDKAFSPSATKEQKTAVVTFADSLERVLDDLT
ncbi:unnamed protein product [Calicophoron daubneyi]|uniref:Uncharacterized protein n=1 Tax=Calicophoron daubneyi TaxID=300641 RepID=A0AAV2TV04_CALDB